MKGLTCVKTADRWYKVRVIEVDKQKAISGGHTESNFLKVCFQTARQSGHSSCLTNLIVCLKTD